MIRRVLVVATLLSLLLSGQELSAQTTDGPPADRTLHILAVGINVYAGGLPNLRYAESDARSFADSLMKQAQPIFGAIRVQLILGAAATKDSLAEAFLTLAESVGENDTFVFFFAGHGALAKVGAARTFFLASPQITDLSQGNALAKKAVSAPELAIWLSRIPARGKVLLLDACSSGEIASWCAGNKEAVATYRHVLTELGGPAEAAILAATQPSDPAEESGAFRHGVFTSALLHNPRAPGERPTVMTINDLFRIARAYVREFSFAQGLRDQDLFVLATPVDFPLLVR